MGASPRARFWSWACLTCVFLGSVARLRGFASNSPFWLDEVFIANNLRELSYSALFGPLEYGQYAPIGWLLLNKSLHAWFGDSESALRLPSLAASILTLPVVWWVSHQILGRAWAVVPTFLISFSPFIVWQGLQLKPYALDLFIAALLIALAIRSLDTSFALSRLAAAGFVALWMSMPSVFVLAGIGLVLWTSTTPPRKRLLAVVGFLWALSATVNVLVLLRPGEQPGWLYGYWSAGLRPESGGLRAVLGWLVKVGAAALENPLGLFGMGLAALVPLAIGTLALVAKRVPPPRVGIWFAALPIGMALGGAALRVYPFQGRLILFLALSLALVLTAGISYLASWSRWARGLAVVFAAALLCLPLVLLLVWLPRGGLPTATDMRALVREIEERRAPGDIVVVEDIASYGWLFYGGSQDVTLTPMAFGIKGRRQGLRESLEPVGLDGARVWVVLARAARRQDLTFFEALGHDIGGREPRLTASYRWLAENLNDWAELEELESVLPSQWKIAEEIVVHGGCLWRLRPLGSSGQD